MRFLTLAVIITAFIGFGRAYPQLPSLYEDEYEELEPTRYAYPQWRATAQYGAYHTVLVPNYQWSQRGAMSQWIVPNSALPSMDVAPPRARFRGYFIDASPYLRERYR